MEKGRVIVSRVVPGGILQESGTFVASETGSVHFQPESDFVLPEEAPIDLTGFGIQPHPQ